MWSSVFKKIQLVLFSLILQRILKALFKDIEWLCFWLLRMKQALFMSQQREVWTANMDWGPIFLFSFNVKKRLEEKDGFLFFNLSGTVLPQSSKSFMAVIFWRAVFNGTLSQHSCSNLQLVNLIVEGGFGWDHKDWRCFFLYVCNAAFLILFLPLTAPLISPR